MMRNRFFSAEPIAVEPALGLLRMITGVFLVYHGLELFDADKIKHNGEWLHDLGFPLPLLMSYLGKGAEFFGGILLAFGLLTRLASLAIAITMFIITFGVGEGKIFFENQHPFLFVLLSVLFFFTGPGKWSLDQIFFNRKNRYS